MALQKIKRKKGILDCIIKREHVTVQELCRIFAASEATVRRDLEELSSENLIKRIHGGATGINLLISQNELLKRRLIREKEKESIARKASELIEDGETIFLGSGSTVLALVNYLRERKNLTAISNSLPVINELVDMPDIKVIVIGGLLRKSELSIIGHIAEKGLEELRADKVILGSEAIHLDQGMTNSYLDETMTDRAIIKLSSHIIILADHTKFNKIRPAFWAPLSVVDTIVTDWGVPAWVRKKLADQNIRLVMAGKDESIQ